MTWEIEFSTPYHDINSFVHVEYDVVFIDDGDSANFTVDKHVDELNDRCVHGSSRYVLVGADLKFRKRLSQ